MELRIEDTHEAKYITAYGLMESDPFERQMISQLDHPLFLKPERDSLQCPGQLRYNISGRISLCEQTGTNPVPLSEMLELLAAIGEAVRCLEAFLLEGSDLLADPSCIFRHPKTEQYSFLAIPGTGRSFQENMRTLIEFFFLHADPSDPEALHFVTALMKTALRQDFHMHDLTEIAEKERSSAVRDPSPFPPALPVLEDYPSFDSFSFTDSAPREVYPESPAEPDKGHPARRLLIAAAGCVVSFDLLYFLKGIRTAKKTLPFLLVFLITFTIYTVVSGILRKK